MSSARDSRTMVASRGSRSARSSKADLGAMEGRLAHVAESFL